VEELWGRHVALSELSEHARRQLKKEMIKSEQAVFLRGNHVHCRRCGSVTTAKVAHLPLSADAKPRYFCPACLIMGRMCTQTALFHLPSPVKSSPAPATSAPASVLSWQGRLTAAQMRVSRQLCENTVKPHLVWAVTGAGKTEMLFPLIDEVLSKGGRVAFVSPRVDVCREIAPRLKDAFEKVPQLLLHGGSEEKYRFTPLIVCTTHQLLRFKDAFELVIVDEVDAFPFAGDEMLAFGVKKAVKSAGRIVYLSATPSKEMLQQTKSGELALSLLPARFHRKPLPQPQFIWLNKWEAAIEKAKLPQRLQKRIKKLVENGPLLIFCPEIRHLEAVAHWIKRKLPDYKSAWVYSGDAKRKEKVAALRRGELEILITTTILERGVTFSGVSVLVLGANHRVFNTASLLQILGRVGRKVENLAGEVIFVHDGQTRAMTEVKGQVRYLNQKAGEEGLLDELSDV
jgi:competence protein ComFA